MKFRRILREFTDFPATTTIGILWIVVYVAMAWMQGTPHAGTNWLRGGIAPSTSHLFGDLTSRELYQGQVWRVVTATFVHYSLLHLGLNLLSLYQLGRVVEDWYGTGRFVALYVILGGLGNALSGLARPYLPVISGSNPWLTPSGGGSTAIFGLVTLLGVGAWRSRTRFGDYAKGVVIFLLILNGAIAWFLRQYMDHYGHAGGAIVGALVGLAHHALSRDPEGAWARRTGWAGATVLLACALAQYAADRREARSPLRPISPSRPTTLPEAERRLRAMVELELIAKAVQNRSVRDLHPEPVALPVLPGLARLVAGKGPVPRRIEDLTPAQVLSLMLRDLDAHQGDLGTGPTAEPFRLMRSLAQDAAHRRPTPGQVFAFRAAWKPVFSRASAQLAEAANTLQAAQRKAAPAPAPRK